MVMYLLFVLFSSKGVINHIKNGVRMWNMIKCFISKVKRIAIETVCWKAKIRDWYYMSAINVQYNVQNCFNIKYIVNNKQNNETS